MPMEVYVNPSLAAAFYDELEKISGIAGTTKAMTGGVPKAITSAKALATAPMKVAKPVSSRGGGVLKFRTPSIKTTKNPGQAVSVSPKSGTRAVSTPPITLKAPTAGFA
jgi:hypothetical protein